MSNNLGEIVNRNVPGNRLAYIEAGLMESGISERRLDYQGLLDSVAKLKGVIGEQGLPPGTRIGLMLRNGIHFIRHFLAILQTGLVAVPINYRLGKETIAHIFADAEITIVVVDSERAALAPTGVTVVNADDGKYSVRANHPPVRQFKGIAKILYTSGSTGIPKGVPMSHQGQVWAIKHYLNPLEDTVEKRALVVAPTYHKNGLFFSLVALMNGMTIVSMPTFAARDYLLALEKYRCSTLSGVPTMFALLLKERDLLKKLDLGFVETLSLGSAPVTRSLIEDLQSVFPNAVITNNYGTTEVGPCIFGAHPQGIARPIMSVGYPLPDIQWKLIDGPDANEGILCLKTPALMSGYINRPDATKEKFSQGWYITGDVMRRDDNGFFYFVDRHDDMMVCGGENIYPREVEALLEQHPAILQAVVVAATDTIKGQVPVAFIVLLPGVEVAAQAIKDFYLAKGPAYSHPRKVIIKDSLPLAGTNKIDLKALQAEANSLITPMV